MSECIVLVWMHAMCHVNKNPHNRNKQHHFMCSKEPITGDQVQEEEAGAEE